MDAWLSPFSFPPVRYPWCGKLTRFSSAPLSIFRCNTSFMMRSTSKSSADPEDIALEPPRSSPIPTMKFLRISSLSSSASNLTSRGSVYDSNDCLLVSPFIKLAQLLCMRMMLYNHLESLEPCHFHDTRDTRYEVTATRQECSRG